MKPKETRVFIEMLKDIKTMRTEIAEMRCTIDRLVKAETKEQEQR